MDDFARVQVGGGRAFGRQVARPCASDRRERTDGNEQVWHARAIDARPMRVEPDIVGREAETRGYLRIGQRGGIKPFR